jgi:hypothetical protein
MVEFTDKTGVVWEQTTVYIPKTLRRFAKENSIKLGKTLAAALEVKRCEHLQELM